MPQQDYIPVAGSLALSTAIAAIPIVVLLYCLGIKRTSAWVAALFGLGTTLLVALFSYHMPPELAASAVAYGAAFGLFPICWIIVWAIFLYRIMVETGKFKIVKDSIGNLTTDRRLQALLIAFAFGSFIEGAAGFGTPVAVAAAMLTGLGFSPFYAAAICLLANTAPVAFGSVGVPIVTLAGITGLPLDHLSAGVGLICAPISLLVPAYVILVMGGWKALRGVLPAAVACGVVYALVQFLVSNYVGPHLTAILTSLAAMGVLAAAVKIWKPSGTVTLEGDTGMPANPPHHTGRELVLAWSPYMLLVVFVLVWGMEPFKGWLNSVTVIFGWPGLHNRILQVPPVTAKPTPYAARFTLNWLSASGTACLFASLSSAIALRLPPRRFFHLLGATLKQLTVPIVTIAAVLGMAFLMNYSGSIGTLGLACAATGVLYPFFGTLMGWLGVFLTGSDTSSNALFGNLQVVTSRQLHLNPVLMAAANSSGGVMGKMISLASIAVASAATGMAPHDEARLFRFTLRHSILLVSLVGLLVLFYAYVTPRWIP
ncbi:MAG: L-lactate permease [Bryobacteraceae bacterium]|jgi:lactate permease